MPNDTAKLESPQVPQDTSPDALKARFKAICAETNNAYRDRRIRVRRSLSWFGRAMLILAAAPAVALGQASERSGEPPPQLPATTPCTAASRQSTSSGAGPTVKFSLDTAATTSAGVYSRGVLLKTLWSNVPYPAGAHVATWDGTTDDGVQAVPGPYTVKILSSNAKYTWEGVVGNTSDEFTGPTLHHAQDIVHGMAILGTTMYIATGYNEGRSSTFRMDTANPQRKTNILPTPLANGYTDAVTRFVATDGTLVYWAGCVADLAPRHHFVYATTTSDDHEGTFPRGRILPICGNLIKRSVIDHIDAANGLITGLAVQKKGPWLFVSHRGRNAVHVLDKKSGAVLRTVALSEPTSLAVDGNDNLWAAAVQNGKPLVRKYAVAEDGAISPIKDMEIAGLQNPLALAVSPDNKTLLIADGGTSQQVRAFDNTSAVAKWVLGKAGGYAGDPDVSDDRFFFRNVDNTASIRGGYEWTYLAWQPDGSFWVGDSGNYRSQCYAPDRTFRTRVMWLPMFYTALVDLNDPARVFADMLEFHVDYSRPLAPSNGSWKLVRNWGGTQPPAAYTYTGGYHQRARFPYLTVATLRNGRTYATFRNYTSGKLGIAELDPQRGLRFTGVETPGLYSNLAADGSIRTISHATAGRPQTWSTQTLTGFNASNDPQWGAPTTVASSPPVDRKVFDHAAYTMGLPPAWELSASGIIASFDATLPSPGQAGDAVSHAGWHLAGLDARTGAWRWKAAPSTSKEYRGDWPTDGAFDIGNYVCMAGSFVHVVGSNILWQHIGEGWKGADAAEVNVWTHVHEGGLMIGQFGPLRRILPDGKDEEGQPGMAGNATSHGILRGKDDTIYIYHNDEGFHGGVHRWRISNLASIKERELPLTLGSSVPPKAKDPADLLAGLPRESSVADNTAGWRRTPVADVLKDRNLDWWRVRTSITSYRKDESPDIDIAFAHRPAAAASVTRELGTPPAPLGQWTLSTMVRFSWPNIVPHEGLDVEILDDAGKVIVRLSPTQIAADNYRFLVNGQTLFRSADCASFTRMLRSSQSMAIRAVNGKLTIACGNHPVVQANPLDPASDWRRPRVLKVRAWATTGGYHYSVNFRRLRFDCAK